MFIEIIIIIIIIIITFAASFFHIEHTSFASSWYLFCLSVIVLARLCVFGTAMYIKKTFFVFLFIKVMSGRLKSIVLSLSMLRFQYSLKFSLRNSIIIIIIIINIIIMEGMDWSHLAEYTLIGHL